MESPTVMERPTDEVLLASAINFLYEGHEIHEASLLLHSEIKTHPWNKFNEETTLMVEIIGNREVYDAIQNDALPSKGIIERAFNAVLPIGYVVESITARVDLVNINSSNWRNMMEQLLAEKKALNQRIPVKDRTHRIGVIGRFTAKESLSHPELVVKKFFGLLRKNG